MDTTFQSSAPKQKPKTYTNDNILEAIRNMGTGVAQTTTRDVVGKVASDALASLLGQVPQKSGELQANQSVSFGPRPRERSPFERQPMRPAARSEFNRESLVQMDTMRIRQELAAVRQELKALADSIKNFHQEIQKAIDEVPVNPGIYHVNFLARLRSMLKILREQIDDSRTWLTLSTNRKQKKQYWGMYKKHGTQFGLSSERTIATQAG